MIELKGKYNNAKVYNNNAEAEAMKDALIEFNFKDNKPSHNIFLDVDEFVRQYKKYESDTKKLKKNK